MASKYVDANFGVTCFLLYRPGGQLRFRTEYFGEFRVIKSLLSFNTAVSGFKNIMGFSGTGLFFRVVDVIATDCNYFHDINF
jgi:hypothetical protein